MKTYQVAIAMALMCATAWTGCGDDDPVQPGPNPQPVYGSTVIPAASDNTLYEESDTLSNALGRNLFSGTNNGGALGGPDARRSLVRFAVADSIPAGATIDSVSLQLNLSKASPFVVDATPTALHVVLAAWGEGTSIAIFDKEGGGGSATPGDATWLDRFRGAASLWTNAGGDFTPMASAITSTTATLGPYTWSSSAMAADVQAWLDAPTANFGWILVGDESIAGTARQFDSRDHETSANHPQLTVHYTVWP